MLCRFDQATVKGLYSTAGFVELDHKTPEQAATLILERLAINEGHPKEHYLPLPSGDGTARATATTYNLPRIPPFFGRADELKRIAEALDPHDAPGAPSSTAPAAWARPRSPSARPTDPTGPVQTHLFVLREAARAGR